MEIGSESKRNTILSVKFLGSKIPNNETRINVLFAKDEKASLLWGKKNKCKDIANSNFTKNFNSVCTRKFVSIKVKETLAKYSGSLVKVVFRPCKNLLVCAVCKQLFES